MPSDMTMDHGLFPSLTPAAALPSLTLFLPPMVQLLCVDELAKSEIRETIMSDLRKSLATVRVSAALGAALPGVDVLVSDGSNSCYSI